MCCGYYEQWETPKHLQVINEERIIERTLRLLRENGAKDIYISSNDSRYDEFAPRLEHENSYRYENGKLTGYWLDAFYPKFRKGTKVTYIFGDVYFSEDAIKQIVNCTEDGNILFGSKGALRTDRLWGEPYAFVVNDIATFYKGIKAVKRIQDEGGITNKGRDGIAISWELYRYLNGFDVNEHRVRPETYKVIDDYTDDADTPEKLERIRSRVQKYGNVFTVIDINSIGGGESFLYYMARKYKDRDITIFYKTGDIRQLERLKRYARVIRYTGQKIRCKKVFFNYNQAFKENIEADEYYQVIHADYYKRNLTPKPDDRVKYIAVSKSAAESFKKQTGRECEIISYNPFDYECFRPLILMSATRLNSGKGKDRIEKLAKMLDANGIRYKWLIFTNDTNAIDNENIIYCKPDLDVANFAFICDWFVQLSDDEAFCYSVIEALKVANKPCIITPCPVFDELGLNAKNSLKVNFDLDNFNVEDLYRFNKKFKYEPPEDKWGDILTDDESTYTPQETAGAGKVEILRTYDDVVTGARVKPSTVMLVSRERGKQLINAGVAKWI